MCVDAACSCGCRVHLTCLTLPLQGESSEYLLNFRDSLSSVDQAAALSLHGLRTQADGLRQRRQQAMAEARATSEDGGDEGAQFVRRVEEFCATQVESKLVELDRSLEALTVRRARVVGFMPCLATVLTCSLACVLDDALPDPHTCAVAPVLNL